MKLKCFEGDCGAPEVESDWRINSGQLHLRYTLRGIALPRASRSQPQIRAHELWKTTCLEAFIRPSSGSEYWEFNVSAQGDWNVYHFLDQRQGMKEDPNFTAPEVICRTSPCLPEIFEFDIIFSGVKFAAAGTKIVGHAPVILETSLGKILHYSESHSLTARPDFHAFIFCDTVL